MQWSNWYGNLGCSPQSVVLPQTLAELVSAVETAEGSGLRVRPAGAGHSNVPLIVTDGLVVDVRHFSGLLDVDVERSRVTLGAGTRISDIGPLLWEHGLSLTNQGDIDSQAIAGAIATGTHGTGLEIGSLSGAVVGAQIVTGGGEIRTIDESTPDLLRATRTSLGVLGVLTNVTMEVSPAYCLESKYEVGWWTDVISTLRTRLDANRHFLFYWFPSEIAAGAWFKLDPPLHRDQVLMRTMNPVPSDAALKDADTRIDRAYRVFAEPCGPTFHETEFMVPIERAEEALGAVRDMVTTCHPNHGMPFEIRFIAADDAYLSPFADRASCAVSISGAMGVDNTAFFRDCESVFAEFAGRPHWGKWHEYMASRVEDLYPELGRFRAARAELDPLGTFSNGYLQNMLGTAPLVTT